MVPSSVSVVATAEMLEVARIRTCTMPHGSRLNAAGSRQYSACMMDDALVEIDARAFKVLRHFVLSKGKESAGRGAPQAHAMAAEEASCSPTWAQPSVDGALVYVACNKSDEIVEIEVESWRVRRRLAAGPGVYNLAVTGDGRLVATNKRGQSVSIFHLQSGKELGRVPTTRKVVHGAVVSPDDGYAFVSVEGVGSERGTLEVIDLEKLSRVATVEVGRQAAGVDFWKMQPAKK
jgi:DNA-binding beta-propeller fold protein YncE